MLEAKLRELAERVAEAGPIDWEALEREVEDGDEEHRRVLAGLRIVTKVVAVHRGTGTQDLLWSDTSPTPAEERFQPPPERWGGLVVRARLGRGGYGDVYSAHDTALDREVALKLYHGREPDEDGWREVTHEARLLARIKHPNVVTVHGADWRDGRAGIWMELIRGKTLSQLVNEQGPFSPAVAALIGIDLCRALAAVHRHMLHRDIKAQNVMREEGGRIVLMDFGIGTLASEHAPELRGTPAYLAPELFEREPPSVPSDLYSLGVLLYHLVTDAFPVPGDTASELTESHRAGRRVFLRDRRPDLPDAFVRVVERCLAPDPGKRYVSAGDMEAALVEATGVGAPAKRERPEPGTSGTSGEERRTTRELRWHHKVLRRSGAREGVSMLVPALAAVAAVAALLLGIALIVMLIRPVSAPSTASSSAAGPPTLAVLPVENLTGDATNDFLADGITDIMTTRLASLPGFLIVPRSIVLELGGPGLRTSRTPSVTHVVEGSLQRSADALRLSVRLTDSRRAAVLWSEIFDGSVNGFFELQQQAVQRLVQRVGRMRLAPVEVAALEERLSEPPTLDLEAFALYSDARMRLDRYDNPGNLDRAVEALEEATRRDPDFALAHAALGEACWRQFDVTRDEDWIERAREAALEALRLDPDEPSVRFTLAVIYEFTGRRDRALDELDRTLALQPASPRALRLLGRIHARLGDAARSQEYLDRAVALDPEDPVNYSEAGLAQFRLGRYRDAVTAFETLVRLQPENPSAHQRLGTAYHALGDLDEARRHYERVLALAPSASAHSNLGAIHFSQKRYREAAEAYRASLELDPRSPQTTRNLGEAYDALGEYDESRDAYEKAFALTEAELDVNPDNAFMLSLQALMEARLGRTGSALPKAERAAELDPESSDVLYHRAAVLALADDRDEALRYLEMAIEAGYPTVHVGDDPDWAALRGDSAFQAMVTR